MFDLYLLQTVIKKGDLPFLRDKFFLKCAVIHNKKYDIKSRKCLLLCDERGILGMVRLQGAFEAQLFW